MKVILASASPRRKELLQLVMPKFEIMVSQEKEIMQEGLTPEKQTENLSYIKAKNVYDRTNGDRIIIGADSIVVKNGKIYGKPKNEENAKQMIKELLDGDRTHEVITGLTVLIEKDGKYKEYKTHDKAKVYLENMTDEEINNWVATGKAIDKAGAYGIQTEFGVFVNKIEGNYTTVVGLPIHLVYKFIKQ